MSRYNYKSFCNNKENISGHRLHSPSVHRNQLVFCCLATINHHQAITFNYAILNLVQMLTTLSKKVILLFSRERHGHTHGRTYTHTHMHARTYTHTRTHTHIHRERDRGVEAKQSLLVKENCSITIWTENFRSTEKRRSRKSFQPIFFCFSFFIFSYLSPFRFLYLKLKESGFTATRRGWIRIPPYS